MSQSLYTAMSGIAAANTSLQVISNNVANINTTAFKSSSVNFADVYSTTISYGSVGSGKSGGTNPIQVGVGVQVSAISKNFTPGSATSTGEATDLMIQGSGFFTVTDGAETYYTRAGDFSWDADGNLVTAGGFKVLGTNSILSSTTTKETVYVPTSIIPVVAGNASLGTQSVSNLNNLDKPLTTGYFEVNVTNAGVTTTRNVFLTSAMLNGDVNNMVTQINAQLSAAPDTGVVATVSAAKDGTLTFTHAGVGDLSFSTNNTPQTYGGVSYTATNFLTDMELTETTPTSDVFKSKVVDYTCSITDVTSAAEATSINSVTIGTDGSIQATYSNGDTLSVILDSTGENYEFIYTTSEAVEIRGDSLSVSNNVAVPANFVVQLATVTNTDGLLSVGSNLFQIGPNAGDIIYTTAGKMGAGKVAAGYLEASNVDLSDELSSMILAQRAIQANSRVFTTVSDTLDTIVNMGR